MHLSLPKRFPLFILASSVCRSLQCLISALTQGGEGGLLFRLTCSVVLWGGRNTANKYHWRVWGVLAVSGPYWVVPANSVCAFLVYTTQAPGCSAGGLSKGGPGLRVCPRSKPLRFRFSGTPQRHRLGWAYVLCPSQARAAQVTRCFVNALSPGRGCILSPPPSQPLGSSQACCVSSGELISGCDPRWMSAIQSPRKSWLATGRLHEVW